MNLYATYYQDTTNHYHSSSIDDNELDYSTDSNTQKIVVNVINDKSSSKSTPKSTITKKGIYTSSDTVIGSQNMEDLFQVISDQRSKSSRSTSMIKHVIIIDRHDSDSLNNNQKKQLQTFEIHTSTPGTTNTVSIIPSTGYMVQQSTYYNSQQFIPSKTTTSYITNANNFHSFIYYQY